MAKKIVYITITLICIFLLTSVTAMAAPSSGSDRHKHKQPYNGKQQEEEKEKEKNKREVHKAPVRQKDDTRVIRQKERREDEVRKQPNIPRQGPDNNKHEVRKNDDAKRNDDRKGPEVRPHPGTARDNHQHKEDLRRHWEKERLELRKRQEMHHNIRMNIYQERHSADHYWHRYYSDWHWLQGYSFFNVRLYHSRYSDNVWSVRFSSHQHHHPYLFDMMTKQYGPHGYKKRWHHDDIYGWAFYWVGPHTVIRMVIDDNGNMYTALWNRPELERAMIEVGYLSATSFEYYRSYEIMPQDVMEKYVEDVVDTVEYED